MGKTRFDFAGQVVAVTGAGKGIGKGAAQAFGEAGARVYVLDHTEVTGEATAKTIRDGGGEAAFIDCDVTDAQVVTRAFERIASEAGRLDVLVNSAGGFWQHLSVEETPEDEWNKVLALNLTSVFLCMKHEIAAMARQGGGAIVNISSGAGLIAVPGLGAYCATKHAVLGLTKTAAVENARTGVRVNAVCPGSIDTPMLRASIAKLPGIEKMVLASQPGGRFGRAEEIAEAVVWLCSDRASFVSGESMLVDGGSVAR